MLHQGKPPKAEDPHQYLLLLNPTRTEPAVAGKTQSSPERKTGKGSRKSEANIRDDMQNETKASNEHNGGMREIKTSNGCKLCKEGKPLNKPVKFVLRKKKKQEGQDKANANI